MAIAVIALALLIVPIVGTVWPVPAPPLNYFPYIFCAYLLAGVVLVSIRSRRISEMEGIRKVLDEVTDGPDGMRAALPGQADGRKTASARSLRTERRLAYNGHLPRFAGEPASLSSEVHDGRGTQRGARHASEDCSATGPTPCATRKPEKSSAPRTRRNGRTFSATARRIRVLRHPDRLCLRCA